MPTDRLPAYNPDLDAPPEDCPECGGAWTPGHRCRGGYATVLGFANGQPRPDSRDPQWRDQLRPTHPDVDQWHWRDVQHTIQQAWT